MVRYNIGTILGGTELRVGPSVYQKKNGRWEARYKCGIDPETGRTLYKSVYGATREEAERLRAEIVGGMEETVADTVSAPASAPHLNLLILGAGSHGRNVREIAEQLGVFETISFLDDKYDGRIPTGPDRDDVTRSIIGRCKDALTLRKTYPCAFVAIGDVKMRKKWVKYLKELGFMFPRIISPNAHISRKAVIGEGTCVMPEATVNAAAIGEFGIIASNAVVNIDAKLGDFVHVDCAGIVDMRSKVPSGTWIRIGQVFSQTSK